MRFAMHHMLLQLQRSPGAGTGLAEFHRSTTRFLLAQFPSMADGGSIRPNIRTGAAGYRNGFRVAALERLHGEHRVSQRHVDRFLRNGGPGAGGIPHGNSQALGKREGSHRKYERSSDPGSAGAGGRRDCLVARFPAALHEEARAPNTSLNIKLVVPADLATIYDLNPAFAAGYTGQGQTIAVLEDSDLYNTADWDTFRKAFGLSSYTARILEHHQSRAAQGNFQLFGSGSQRRRQRSDAGCRMGQRRRARTQPSWWLLARIPPPHAGILIAAQNLVNAKAIRLRSSALAMASAKRGTEWPRMRPTIRCLAAGGGGRHVGVCCGGRRRRCQLRCGIRCRHAWHRRQRLLPLRPITSRSEEPISAIHPRARANTYWGSIQQHHDLRFGALLHSGDPLERLVRRFDPGSYSGLFGWLWPRRILWEQHGATIWKHCSGRGQRRAKRVRNRRSGGKSGGGRQLQGIRETCVANGSARAFRTMASAIFPMCRSSPPTVSGATTTCSAFPIRTMAADRAWARRLTGPAGAELRLPPQSWLGFRRW